MLRVLFVLGIIAVGVAYSLKGPFYVLLFYLWNAYFRPEYWLWYDFVSGMRLSFVIGVVLVAMSLPSLLSFRLSGRVWLIVLFIAQSGLSVLVSPHQSLAMPFWIEFVKVGIVALLITHLVDTEARLRLAFIVVAYSLGFEAAKQGWAQLVLNPGATNNNPHLMLGDNNGVAMGMMMLIPIFMALSQTTSSRWERYIHRFFIAGVIYRGVSTYSRGGFLAASLVALTSLWRAQHKIRTIVAMTAIVLTISAVMPQQFWDRMQTITAPEEERDASVQGRLYFWGLALEMASDRPWTGVGFNSYRYSFDRYDDDPGFGAQRAVHSAWFGVLSELGYPGLVIFLALLASSVTTCYRIRRDCRRRGWDSLAAYAGHLQTSVLVFVVGGTFLNAQYLELLWHLLAFTVALDRIHAARVAESTSPAAPRAPVAVNRAGDVAAFRLRGPAGRRVDAVARRVSVD